MSRWIEQNANDWFPMDNGTTRQTSIKLYSLIITELFLLRYVSVDDFLIGTRHSERKEHWGLPQSANNVSSSPRSPRQKVSARNTSFAYSCCTAYHKPVPYVWKILKLNNPIREGFVVQTVHRCRVLLHYFLFWRWALVFYRKHALLFFTLAKGKDSYSIASTTTRITENIAGFSLFEGSCVYR